MAISMGLFDDKPINVTLNPAVDEMCEHLANQRRRDWAEGMERRRLAFHDEGFRGAPIVATTKEDFERMIKSRKRALSNFMSQFPREDGEAIDAYATRLTERGHGDRWGSRMDLLAEIAANIARIEDEEADARLQRKREKEAEEARRHAANVKAASPDRKEIDRLLAKIEDARDGEKLLANIAAALEAHRAAQAARTELSDIFDRERRACTTLGKRVPSRPKVPDAPDGARKFAAR